MKQFLLCADVEGASGVGNAAMLRGDTFQQVREMITSDINACARGIRDFEPNAVIDLFDAHGLGGNVIEEKLEQDVRLLGGGWIATLFPLVSTGQMGRYDGLFLLGQHAANGTKDGFLSHTNSKHTALRVNSRDSGEAEQLAWLAGAYGVPTLLVVGDDATQREANALLPGVRAVSVKCAVDRQTAKCRPVDEVWREIEAAASSAVAELSNAAPSLVNEPVQIVVFLSHPTMTKPAKAFRDVSVDDRGIVRFESPTFIDGWFQYQTISRVCSEFGFYKETCRRLGEHNVAKKIAENVIAEFNDSVYREDSPIPDVHY